MNAKVSFLRWIYNGLKNNKEMEIIISSIIGGVCVICTSMALATLNGWGWLGVLLGLVLIVYGFYRIDTSTA